MRLDIIIIVGVFGLYFALTGARIGQLKNSPVTWFEKAILLIGGMAVIALLYYAVDRRSLTSHQKVLSFISGRLVTLPYIFLYEVALG